MHGAGDIGMVLHRIRPELNSPQGYRMSGASAYHIAKFANRCAWRNGMLVRKCLAKDLPAALISAVP